MRRVELSDMDHGEIEYALRLDQKRYQDIVNNPATKTPERIIARSKVAHIAELRRRFMAAEVF